MPCITVKSSLTAHKIRECYKTAQDGYETTGIVLAPVEDVLAVSESLASDDGADLPIRLAPAAQGSSGCAWRFLSRPKRRHVAPQVALNCGGGTHDGDRDDRRKNKK